MKTLADMTVHEMKQFEVIAIQYLQETTELFAEAPQLTLGCYGQWAVDSLWMRLRQKVMGEDIDETLELRTPCSWWEMFKEEHFPKWAKKRWPPKYRVEKWHARVLYPWIAPRAGVTWIEVTNQDAWKEARNG